MAPSSDRRTGAGSDSSEALTHTLVHLLREALVAVPQLAPDPEALAERLAPTLAAGLTAEAQGEAPAGSTPARDTGEIGARVFQALQRHPAGRMPGLAPDALGSLTGIPSSALGPAVSELVQSGRLVRDGWLVRLPQPADLLPGLSDEPEEEPERRVAVQERGTTERRAIGDRRALGERRLYERRSPER